jgi:hypothetical protein
VTKRLPAAFDVLIRLMLVLGLAYTPLAQAFAMAAMTSPQQESASVCPHHAEAGKADSAPSKPGGCCAKKGSACHCAMTLALVSSTLPATSSASSDHPVSAPRLISSAQPAPESPPPRA